MNFLGKINRTRLNLKNHLTSIRSITNSLPIILTKNANDESFDSVVIIGSNLEENVLNNSELNQFQGLKTYKNLNSENFEKCLTYAVLNEKRVIYSATGPLNRDYDDVRRISDAARAGLESAIKLGSKSPLLINTVQNTFQYADKVSLLSSLETSYLPLEVRESKKTENCLKIDKLGFWSQKDTLSSNELIQKVNAIELGRIVAKDIGGSDPERMCAANVLEYVQNEFKSTDIKMNFIDDQATFLKSYPCFAAVNRAACEIPRHRGRIIQLEYTPAVDSSQPIDTTLFLVGKGLTYDTGGADIKYGGSMAGMHRDKCGAAFVAGFFKTLSILKPKGLKVYGTLCLTRNNVGEECYVTDEIITARSGKRIRVGNTDAEGRMAIIDSLCEAREKAVNEVNPQLFTIATLTGHVIKCYGTDYTSIMSNGPARELKIDSSLQECGDLISDPYEISRIRREDYKHHKGQNEYEDLLQCEAKPSALSARGHQGPAAFLMMGSLIDKHCNDSKDKKLPYTHVDIAGSAGWYPQRVTAAPLPSFSLKYILSRL